MKRYFAKVSFEQYKKDVGGDIDLSKEYEDIKLPRRATKRSSGYDIYSVCNFQLHPGEEVKLPTGIKIYMHDDEEFLIFPRSSIGFKYNVKINNTIGKIDSDYVDNPNNEGHVWIKFTNTGNKIWDVKKGDAIAQGTFYKYLITDNDIPVNEKRIGGIGSSNKKITI